MLLSNLMALSQNLQAVIDANLKTNSLVSSPDECDYLWDEVETLLSEGKVQQIERPLVPPVFDSQVTSVLLLLDQGDAARTLMVCRTPELLALHTNRPITWDERWFVIL